MLLWPTHQKVAVSKYIFKDVFKLIFYVNHVEETKYWYFFIPTDSELTLVEINILPIDLPSMYLKKKADLVCSVNVQGNADVDVKWVDENDEEPQQKSVRGKTATVMISYDEWSKGLRWSCVATIKDSINPPVRKYFEKNNGECIFFR